MTELWLDATDDWRSHAACRRMVAAAYPEDRQYIANLWHPVRGDCEGPDATEAKAVCNGIPGEKAACPVRAECLATYLNQKHGVFGGTTPKQRERIRANRLRRRRAVRVEERAGL